MILLNELEINISVDSTHSYSSTWSDVTQILDKVYTTTTKIRNNIGKISLIPIDVNICLEVINLMIAPKSRAVQAYVDSILLKH